ncbi:hypothetical protein Vadar_027550 [Vaccinium darrowii]|uniref:Uncharacterized protein n=1 Tax=Vaccinium darrowii TaxID=229202 RepID=A0ACB7ZFN8_9ERIC|nr:hypothetical protein Vadar_027550 [Vaccinium darrowii]
MLSSVVAVARHVPINVLLYKAKGIEGVSMAIWTTDLMVVILVALYVSIAEICSKGGRRVARARGSRLDQLAQTFRPVLPDHLPEWWFIEILVLLTGRLTDSLQAVGVLAIVLNFDYLLYSVMLQLSTCAFICMFAGRELAGPSLLVGNRVFGLSIVAGCISGQ